MRIIMSAFYVILILIGISFAGLNAASVKINIYFATFQIPVSLLMVLMLAIGVLIGLLLFLSRYLNLKAEHRRIKNQLKLTEKEIKNLRAIPLQD